MDFKKILHSPGENLLTPIPITAALAITFPFNIAFGIPIDYQMAQMIGAI